MKIETLITGAKVILRGLEDARDIQLAGRTKEADDALRDVGVDLSTLADQVEGMRSELKR
jgi:hypothetical protein